MFKKIVVAMSTILILVSCLVPFSVSAGTSGVWLDDEGQTYSFDYVNVQQFKDKKIDFPFIIYFDGMSSNTNPQTKFTIYAFKKVPTLFYDETNDIYYFDAYEDDNVAFLTASKKRVKYDYFDSGISSGKRYIYFNDFSFSKNKTGINLDVSLHKDMFYDTLYENVTSDFIPLYDESVPESAKNEFLHLLSEEGWEGYYDNVSISITPDSLQTEINKKDSLFLRDGVTQYPDSLMNSPSLMFFTLNIINRGDEDFTFMITANKNSYIYGTASNVIDEVSNDLLNIYSISGNQYFTIPGGESFTHNFNFDEISHLTKYDHSKGFVLPEHEIFINIWTKTPGRVVKGIPTWNGLDEYPGDTTSWEKEKFECSYSKDFTVKAYWTEPVKKPDGYNDVIKNSPVADLVVDGMYDSVEFDLNPSMDDFNAMIDSSKGFLEFVRYTMANFVPQWFWIIIAAGLTGIVILRILGR